uniref:NADH-quinone oxidoreductase subunit D domain-containing protein n=1 Tax=Phaseolus vulgaris TaxID=3885 RepID=V7CN66_PHAVU|nr:hypothetical protein PHAVU_002G146500g [Phaseolus vulgaris]ESW30356.1 hypothetical protein PHAVU_002G146500g [Phaseolus vulgaris]
MGESENDSQLVARAIDWYRDKNEKLSLFKPSIKIIQQALEGLPGGPYENLEIRCFDREKEPEWNEFEYRFISKKSSPSFELPKQELYVRIEAPKGELGARPTYYIQNITNKYASHPPSPYNSRCLKG